ncbi:MAG: Stp1/IreP family PP2C-type Ser/Thr phosphatase [Myxococcota bacterium]|nr:Stp1/IreP family PP2C-type Ser/Thr phosphatase [Myxococcota bacterium]
MQLSVSAVTDVGLVREGNEDSFLVDSDLGLFIVADGMGGHRAGEHASSMSIDVVRRVLGERQTELEKQTQVDGEPREDSPAVNVLRDAMQEANATVFAAGAADPNLKGMGTTVTSALILGQQAFIGHVGDSRAYLLRQGQLYQVTMDHSLVAEQVRLGLMTEAQSRVSQYRNIITRSVGVDAEVEVDLYYVSLEEGDLLLLCSDGLNGMITDEQIADVLRQHLADQCPKALVELACEHGGEDNITAVCVFVGDVNATLTDSLE